MIRVLIQCAMVLVAASAVRAQNAAAWPEQPVTSKSDRVAVLEDKRIKESSGVCRSGRDPAIFWTFNDSGGEPCVFAFDLDGKARAKVRLRDAANFDWEDMALGRDEKGAAALFVGDIGDNFRMRPTIQVYQIPEPDVGEAGRPVNETQSVETILWRAHYPDGKHNAESLLVHPKTNRVYILTKSEDGKSALYAFPEKMQREGSMILVKIAELVFPAVVRVGKKPRDNCMTTGACFAPDGTRMVVATYSSLYEWTLPEGVLLERALQQPPVRIEPELLRQVEGVCYDRDSLTLWITSEHLPAVLLRVTR